MEPITADACISCSSGYPHGPLLGHPASAWRGASRTLRQLRRGEDIRTATSICWLRFLPTGRLDGNFSWRMSCDSSRETS